MKLTTSARLSTFFKSARTGWARLALTITIFAALVPIAGWRLPAAWLAAMLVLILGERLWPTRRELQHDPAPPGVSGPSWLLSLGYSAAALYLVMFHSGAGQTLGVTLFGVVIFSVLVSDYAEPRRLILNLSPPLLAIALVQFAAGSAMIGRHETFKIVTLIASPVAVFLVFRNLQSNLTRNRRQLSEARDAAEAAVIAKSDFLANMSHEIRTPLTAIIGFTGLLENSPDLSDETRLHVRRIASGGQSLLAVVNDILDFSKLEANQVILDPQPFDPWDLIDNALALVATQAAAKGLTLHAGRDGNLPARVTADGAKLRQVLLNLLANAIKFTDAGAVTVTARYDAAESRLHVAVRDTGPGIPVDKRDRLFARFSQVDSSISRQFGGAGLGLAISRGLVELMGGHIDVESEVGEGSTFSFAIAAPRAQAVDAERAPASLDPTDPSALILIADDVAQNRELVRMMLNTLGHQVEEAAGGAEAVAAARDRRYDLILMDMQMPGVDGLAASRLIRQGDGPNAATPILAFSANVMADQVAECLAAGMNDHISKPIQPQELVAKVSLWLSQTGQPKQPRSQAMAG
jgi:signal transduction histidine kinase/CheY-like chemotaxis protein